MKKKPIKKFLKLTYCGLLLYGLFIVLLGGYIYFNPKPPENGQRMANIIQVKPLEVEGVKRIITAYNLGDRRQTDNTPCIMANNKNGCELVKQGVSICASNNYPLGTELYISGWGTCIVMDKMAKKNTGKVDIAFALEEYQEAKEWGVKRLEVVVLNN